MFLNKFQPHAAHANKFRNYLDMSIDWWKRHTTEADQFATCFKKLADKKPGTKFAVVVSGTRAVVLIPARGVQNFLLWLQPPKVFGFGSRMIWSNKY